MSRPLNKVMLDYYFEGERWDYIVYIEPEHLQEYYGKPIPKDLFPFIDFDRLVEEEYSFSAWLKKKYEPLAREEYDRYCL